MNDLHTLYYAAKEADDAFQAALVAQYGKHAGDMRYSYDHPAHIKPLRDAKVAADEAYHNACTEDRKRRKPLNTCA